MDYKKKPKKNIGKTRKYRYTGLDMGWKVVIFGFWV